MTYKRERSYTLFIDDKYIFLDGLNNNIDVFELEDFRYVATIETLEKNTASACKIGNYYLFGS